MTFQLYRLHGRSVLFFAMSLAMVGCSAGQASSLRDAAQPVRHLALLPDVDPTPQIVSTASDVRVMTFNLRTPTLIDVFNYWGFRKELVVETIRKFDPDVLGTQECVLEQADYLRRSLPAYEFVGVGRDDGKTSGEMCGLLFKRDKYTRLDSGNFWLSATPQRPGSRSWGSAFTRMVTWVKLKPKNGGQPFCVFNTHFDVFGKRARVESAKLLRSEMRQIADTMPAIVTGDFNDNPESTTYHTMIAGMPGSTTPN